MTYVPLEPRSPVPAFLLVYCTFCLDNVLLTALVPVLPEWSGATVAGASLNGSTVTLEVGGAAAAAGLVLGARSAAQILCAPVAAALTTRAGPAPALRLGTLLLLAATAALAACGARYGGDHGSCLRCAGLARGVQGAGSALAGVAGMALVSAVLRPPRRSQALAALFGAVALGVLVGYPLGGASAVLWSTSAPFHIVAAALLVDIGLQYIYLKNAEYSEGVEGAEGTGWGNSARGMWQEARYGAGAGAGAVFCTTAMMAALEPCLPLWVEHQFHPQQWALGAVFLPDSVAYLAATSGVPAFCGCGKRAQAASLAGLGAVALGGALVARAGSIGALAVAQASVGAGVGALDAALVPALLSRSRSVPHRAALLQAAASAAYAIGPVAAGAGWWAAGFGFSVRALGAANLLYALLLAVHFRKQPLPEQVGGDDISGSELSPLQVASSMPQVAQ